MSVDYRGPYRHGDFNPLAQPGEPILLIDESGPYGSTPWYEVQFVDTVKGLGAHGVTTLWTPAGAAPAGYSTPPSAGQGTINSGGGQLGGLTPGALTMGKNQLLQFRWRIAVGPTLASGLVADDLDLMVNSPAAIAKNGSQTVQGRHNMIDQAPSPADSIAEPAQAANKALPAAYPGYKPSEEFGPASELFCLETKYQPAFTIINNGVTNLVSGLVGIRVYGYRYDLRPITDYSDTTDWIRKVRFGTQMFWPATIQRPAVVPLAGRGSAAG